MTATPHAPARSVVPATPTGGMFALRREIPPWLAIVCGALCLALVFGVWQLLTYGPGEQRVLSPTVLPSPGETFATFPSLWFERALTRNTFASLRRVTLGFLLATSVGVPIGVLCGCFTWVKAFFMPVIVFGRNIPIAALIPLTFSLFGIEEFQKVMFIFIACVAFIIADTADAVADVSDRYIDTAYTLGASRWQVILKVLVPLALPSVFNSLRLLFGLAFGYVMLAELVKFSSESGGLGDIINMSQKRGNREHILLVLMVIPLVALAIDRFLFWVQRELFPHRYGGEGTLRHLVRYAKDRGEDFWHLFFTPAPALGLGRSGAPLAETASSAGGPAGPAGKEPLVAKEAGQTLDASKPTDPPLVDSPAASNAAQSADATKSGDVTKPGDVAKPGDAGASGAASASTSPKGGGT
ncbi:MAG TPA: ABC transporter permease [Pirellulales bacterium]